jgi:uncharacterized membrane protein YdbT with pleckstrin-like domain
VSAQPPAGNTNGPRGSGWRALQRLYHRYVVPDFRDHRLYSERTGTWEVVKYGERRHVVWLLSETWIAVLIAATSLVVTLAAPPGALQLVLAVVCVVAQSYFLFKLVDWSVTRFYVTDYRLVELGGFLDLTLNEIPKTKLTDIQLRQSLLGKLLGYGTIRVETAGQHQALNEIEYVRLPHVLNRELSSHSLT